MNDMAGEDTIVALATPPGRSAVALIRVSGPRAQEIVARHVGELPDEPRHVILTTVRDASGSAIDQALVTMFAEPQSYTGEDVIEIATHGGAVAPALVMAALIGSGARMALPGEFTRRAVLNGKLDLVQAEAVGDLIDAGSRAMQRAALNQLDGGLSRRIDDLRERVIGLEALIAYDIDFPEEDDGPISRERVEDAMHGVLNALNALLATAPAGELVRSGAVVVIAGAPNAGKSSLFNALLGSARAIVTDIPGTTRDAIEALLDADPWPVRLVDTAGLRQATNVIERLGIEVSERYLSSADVILACGESDESVATAANLAAQLSSAPVIRVRTKADLDPTKLPLAVSAFTGAGLRDVMNAIAGVISERYGAPPVDAPVLTRERHRYAVTMARDEIMAFMAALGDDGLPVSVAAVHLRAAAGAMAEVTGAIDVEDILDSLFRTFCVGK